MSLVDLRQYADALSSSQFSDLAPFGDGGTLTEGERLEVRSILTQVARRLANRSLSMESMRRRLGAIVESLIAVADALDGDCEDEGAQCEDEGGQCEDEGAQCDDEGAPDDNGIADADGLAEQWVTMHLYGGRVA